MGITIAPVEDSDALTELILFHDDVYRSRTARWTAFVPLQLPLLMGEGPFARDRRLRSFAARDGGRLVARVVAVIDERYQRHWREPLGHLILFEALPDTCDAVRALVAAASDWLAAAGARAARAGFGLFDFPFTIDAYEALPPAWLRQNPAGYHALLKDAGFETERGWVDYKLAVRPELVARWEESLAAVRRGGFRIVPLSELAPAERSARFVAVWNETFAAHWGFVPFSEEEFALMAELFAPAGMLDVSVLAYRGDEPVGALWVVPETAALASCSPGRALLDAERLNVLGIGVRTPARGRGVNLGMAAFAYLELARRGATHLSYTLVLDDNWRSRRTAERLGASVCANYVTYRRNLAPG